MGLGVARGALQGERWQETTLLFVNRLHVPLRKNAWLS